MTRPLDHVIFSSWSLLSPSSKFSWSDACDTFVVWEAASAFSGRMFGLYDMIPEHLNPSTAFSILAVCASASLVTPCSYSQHTCARKADVVVATNASPSDILGKDAYTFETTFEEGSVKDVEDDWVDFLSTRKVDPL